MGYSDLDSLREHDQRQEDANDVTARPSAGSEWTQGRGTILLVDDEELVRALARQVLNQNGYTVLEAQHGGEAIQLSEQHHGPIHLMLTDVVMPRMSGFELARQLTRARPEMKVLYMSGCPERAMAEHGGSELDVPYLQKPFTLTALADKVREMIEAKGDHAERAVSDSPRANRCSSTTAC